MTSGTSQLEKDFPHLERLMEVKFELEQLKWYQFIKRSVLKSELRELEYIGINLGIQKGIRDLEKWGIIKLS